MTRLRSEVNGDYSVEELKRLQWPVAWSGTVPADEAAVQEADRRALVTEALAAIEEFVEQVGCLGEPLARIKDGELIEVFDEGDDTHEPSEG